MRRQIVVWTAVVLVLTLTATGCGSNQGRAPAGPPSTGQGASAVQNPGDTPAGTIGVKGETAQSKDTSPAERQAIQDQVNATLSDIDKNLKAVGPDSTIDPNTAAGGF